MKLLLLKPSLPASDEPPMASIRALLTEARDAITGPHDLVLLPEHVREKGPRAFYLDDMRRLAADLGCHVVGGSFHQERADGSVNAGAVFSPDGELVGEYEKLRPYAAERARVRPGTRLGELRVGRRRLLIVICADFWFLDLFFRAKHLPDLVLVPAFSVTRKPSPDYSRSLWQHLAIARAYELGLYVGISDWAHSPTRSGRPTSGVSGFADPVTHDPSAFFTPVGDEGFAVFDLDFSALDAFRRDRMDRGFFWKSPQGGGGGPTT